jgi:hypothetical protein
MNNSLIFLIIATSILVLSAVVICVSPIINNIEVNNGYSVWSPSSWKNLNCKIISDQEKADGVSLDNIQKYRRYKNICYRQKAMYGLEYSAFIINIILTFVCADLTLLHYLNIGKDFEKKTGLIGLISGIIGFILTLVYVCFSGYIFTNDAAYGIILTDPINFYPSNLVKLYPNGARYKWEASSSNAGKYVTVNENDKGEYANYLLYKDLGKKQYNYNSEYYETYHKNPGNSCNKNSHSPVTDSVSSGTSICEYLYYRPREDVVNKYIYDRWLTSLILSVIIIICEIGLIIFGFLLFKNNEEPSPTSEQTPIVYKK